jgi:hypothetical protein
MPKEKEKPKPQEPIEDSAELEALGNKVMEQYRGSALKTNLLEQTPKIKWLLNTRLRKYLGTCARASATWRKLAKVDYVICVQKDFWEGGKHEDREALILHELKHVQWIEPREDDEGDIVKPGRWTMRRHDVEEFVDVVAAYGPWEAGLNAMMNAKQAAAEAPKKAKKKADPLDSN